MTSEEVSKEYTIIPVEEHATYSTEQWVNVLSDGKEVMVEAMIRCSGGDFSAELTETEKIEILSKETIVLNDYCATTWEIRGGSFPSVSIANKNQFSEVEVDEIYRLLYGDEDDADFDTQRLEEHGWDLGETIYGFNCKCKLE